MINDDENRRQLRLAANGTLRWIFDRGYVRLVDFMGTELSVVNAARVSFAKESKDFSDSDEKLIKFLLKKGHTSPFRHAFLTFEVKAPLFVARQWWKYVVGSDHTMDAWNEMSRRYVEDELEFYIPFEWRQAPENKKQGSGENVHEQLGERLSQDMELNIRLSMKNYQYALNMGVCAEQARLFLPAYAMYTTWRWSASLQSVLHFLSQRTKPDAQFEIQKYANAVLDLTELTFPGIIKCYLEEENE